MRKMNGKQAQKGIDRDLGNSNGKKKQKKNIGLTFHLSLLEHARSLYNTLLIC